MHVRNLLLVASMAMPIVAMPTAANNFTPRGDIAVEQRGSLIARLYRDLFKREPLIEAIPLVASRDEIVEAEIEEPRKGSNVPGGDPSKRDARKNVPGGGPSKRDARKNVPGGGPSKRDARKNVPGGGPSKRGGRKNVPGGGPSKRDARKNVPGGGPSKRGGRKNVPGGGPSKRDARKNVPGGGPSN